jgi:hypothetical protein
VFVYYGCGLLVEPGPLERTARRERLGCELPKTGMKRKCCANPLYRRDHRNSRLTAPCQAQMVCAICSCLRRAAPAAHEQHRTAIHAHGQSIGKMITPPTREVLSRNSGNDDRIVQSITLAVRRCSRARGRRGRARPGSGGSRMVEKAAAASWLTTRVNHIFSVEGDRRRRSPFALATIPAR